MIEQDATRKLKLISDLTEVKDKLRMELENAARSPEEIIVDEAKNALRHETSAVF